MIDVLCKVQHPTQHLRLNRTFHNDPLVVENFPFRLGMAAAFSTMTNGSPLDIWNYTPMHASLA